MKPNTRNPIFPEEIIFEIFSWLPVKSLVQFRCVSKKIYSLMLESEFVDIHHRRSMIRDGGTKFLLRKIEGFYTIERNEDGKNYKWNPNNRYDYVMYANGLFCMWKDNVETPRIWNPSTREVIRLPNLRRCGSTIDPLMYNYSLGYEPEEKKYKVLMTQEFKRGSRPTKNWVFTLSIDEEWREIESTVDFIPSFNQRVCVNGVIYMLDYKINKAIVAFDVKGEKFRIIKLWKNFGSNNFGDYNLIEVKGKLGVVNNSKLFGEENLWILRNSRWRRHIIRFTQEVELGYYTSKEICNSCDGEIVFIVSESYFSALYIYDIRKNSWKYLKIQQLPGKGCIYNVFCFAESVFSSPSLRILRHLDL
ncbi:hypothetical protein MTR67_041695 [Solanum verrucosum]|uniref:F-box domain-containing protein n=1 Tax=Solanum verrucosum TaxID=315347 RepID=A0AAF0UL58_SOLVR|nr:hypothetical protein MTR67_041695 [Solanum verrucosum]